MARPESWVKAVVSSRRSKGQWHSESTKIKMRHPKSDLAKENMKKAWTPERKESHARTRAGIPRSDSVKEKIRSSVLLSNSLVSEEEKLRRSEARILGLRKVYRATIPEKLTADWLSSIGLKFLQSKGLPGIFHPYDFLIPDKNLVIEVDGCYWHGCPKHHGSGSLRLNLQKKRDSKWNLLASEKGWIVVRIWECEVREKDFSKVLSVLKEEPHG